MSSVFSDSKARKIPINSSGWSFTDDEIVKYDHVWSIANFDRKIGMKNGEKIRSGKFEISFKGITSEWYLEIYPNGNDDEDIGYVSLYLHKANTTPEPVQVEAIFYTVNQQGVKEENGKKFRYTFQSDGDDRVFGMDWYQNHTKINLSGSKTYTILCEMCLLGDMVLNSGTNHTNISNRSPLDVSSFIESGEFSDCIIKCGDKEYNCHKIVLAGSSTVFKAMFSNDFKEDKSSEVVIEDLEESTVDELIHYIYSGTVRNLNDHAIKLLAAADKYDLGDLKDTCELYLRDKISKANICDILIVADLHNSKILEDSAFRFVTMNGNEVLGQSFADKLKLFPHILVRLLKASLKK